MVIALFLLAQGCGRYPALLPGSQAGTGGQAGDHMHAPDAAAPGPDAAPTPPDAPPPTPDNPPPPSPCMPHDESCNGADDDCDGQTDEELAPIPCEGGGYRYC